MASSSALVSTASNSSAAIVRPRRLEHGVAIGRELGAHDLEHLDRQLALADRTAGGGPGRARARTGRCASGGRARRPSRSTRSTQIEADSWHVSIQFGLCGNAAKTWLQLRGYGFRTRLPERPAGRGLSPRGSAGAHRRAPHRGAANGSGTRRSARAISAPAQSRSHGVWYERKAFRPATGPRLKRASGSLQWDSAFQAEPERWSGIRTRDRMFKRHLLYPSELSSLVRSAGIEPAPPGFNPVLYR